MWELQYVGVAVCELQFVRVAMRGSCGVRNLWCLGIAMCELRCVRACKLTAFNFLKNDFSGYQVVKKICIFG